MPSQERTTWLTFPVTLLHTFTYIQKLCYQTCHPLFSLRLSLSVGGHVSAHASLSHQHFQLSTSHPKLCVTSIWPCLCVAITFSTQSLLLGCWSDHRHYRFLITLPLSVLSPCCTIVIIPTVEPLTGPRPDLTARAANHQRTSISSHATGRHSFGP